jgi:DNA polymerase III subunit alpha
VNQFFNAHNHTYGSFLDGMSKPEEYAQRAIDLGQPCITSTDHGNLHTLMDTYKSAKELGIPFMPGCLTPGQPIITSQGIKNVEDIEVGDVVLTHKGRYRKVIRTFARPYSGDIYNFILSDSGRCMTITNEHPVLIKDIRNELNWIQAADIKVGQVSQSEASRLVGKTTRHKMNRYLSYVCFPRNSGSSDVVLDIDSFMPPFLIRNDNFIVSEWAINPNSDQKTEWNIPTHLCLDQEFAWVIGLFAAEGSFSGNSSISRENRGFLNGQFSICLNSKESILANRFQKFFEERFSLSGRRYERPGRNIIEIEFSCLPIAFILEGLVGRGAKNKKVPTQIKDSPIPVQKSFLLGLLDGDGKQLLQKSNITQVQTLKTASESLAWGVKEIMASLGYWVSVYQGEATSKLPQGSIHTGTYYSVHVKFNPKYTRYLSDDKYVFKPIASISKEYVDCHVYNFEVEEDNSYVGEFVLHNCEFYRARKTRFDHDQEEMSGPSINEWGQRGPYHQTILAYNNVGYVNLMKLSSAAYLEGFARKPRVDLELIEKHSEGLVILSGCLSGAVQQALLRDDYEAALAEASTMQSIVGKDNYFIEIMDHGILEEKAVHEGLIKIAKAIGAPIVPTCDSHYTHKHDHDEHDILLCISTGSKLDTPNRFKFSGDEFYLKSYEEMVELFPKEWVHNTLLIPEKLDINIDLGSHHYPVFEIPQESPIKLIPDYFIKEINNGAEYRFGPNWKTERRDVAERLNSEVKIIQEMGYDSYFLIVADIIKWCLENGILIGPGRGSSASSLVSYCMGITHINPLEYGLLFERFLTPGRVPDIDVDVDSRYRDKVLEYIRDKYGHEKTAQITTISQLRAKSCINDVARVMGFPFNFSQDLVKAMPPAQYGVTKTLDQCLEAEEFLKMYNEDPDVKRVVDVGKKLENLWRGDGVHAGGIIIADDEITNYCPVKQKGPDEPIVTQWDMRTAEEVGLLKIDMLGLTTLDIIQDTIERVKKVYGVDIGPPYELVENADPAVFKFLSGGNTAQVFQMGGDGLTNLAKAMGIESVKDIMAALALYRPGPMSSGFHHSYAKRKRGKQRPVPLHPLLKEVLKDTYGILLYQEQVMAVAKDIAGFEPTSANKFLKSIGKKDREAMAATKEVFIKGCVETSSISEHEAAELFAAIEPHADYSFSRCLSGDTLIRTDKELTSINSIRCDLSEGKSVFLESYDTESQEPILDECIRVIDEGIQDLYRITLEDGTTIEATMTHKFLCVHDNRYHTLQEIIENQWDIVTISLITSTQENMQ